MNTLQTCDQSCVQVIKLSGGIDWCRGPCVQPCRRTCEPTRCAHVWRRHRPDDQLPVLPSLPIRTTTAVRPRRCASPCQRWCAPGKIGTLQRVSRTDPQLSDRSSSRTSGHSYCHLQYFPCSYVRCGNFKYCACRWTYLRWEKQRCRRAQSVFLHLGTMTDRRPIDGWWLFTCLQDADESGWSRKSRYQFGKKPTLCSPASTSATPGLSSGHSETPTSGANLALQTMCSLSRLRRVGTRSLRLVRNIVFREKDVSWLSIVFANPYIYIYIYKRKILIQY